jgi:hypothetical protein
MKNIDNYLDSIYMQEDINSIFPSISKSITSKLKGMINVKDPVGSMKKISKAVPNMDPNKKLPMVERFLSSKIDKYDTYKKMTVTVLTNSVNGLTPKTASALAPTIIAGSMLAKKSNANLTLERNLKLNLKEIVVKARKFGEDFEEEDEDDPAKKSRKVNDIADLSVAWAVILVISTAVIGAVAGGWVVLSIISAIVAAWWFPVIVGLVILAAAVGLAAWGSR